MCSIKWRCFWRPWWPLPPKPRKFLHISSPFISLQCVNVGILILIHRSAIASPSIRTTNRPWKGRGYITWSNLNLEGTISQEWLKLELSNFVYRWALSGLTKRITITAKREWLWSRDLFKFLTPLQWKSKRRHQNGDNPKRRQDEGNTRLGDTHSG